MALSKEFISKLKEEPLQGTVLMPLFKGMGFKDVFQYHGGPLEQGKDIVMWKADDLGNRVNYGVVVKAVNISGKASGKSSAAEVRMQIEQCLSNPYIDPVTAHEERVNRCWVVCSNKIKKEALNTLDTILESGNLKNNVTFINGDKLWELVEQYLSERTVVEKLNQVRKILDSSNPHYRIDPHIKGDVISFSLHPKYPGAEKEHPLKVTGRFTFPKTVEGQKKFNELDSFFKKGSPFTISEEYIEGFSIPNPIRNIIGEENLKPKEIKFGSPSLSHIIQTKFEIECNDGNIGTLDNIQLRPVQVGSEEITLSNREQASPWKTNIVFDLKNHRVRFDLDINYENINVKKLVEVLNFQFAMAKGGRFSIINLDTGIRYPKINIEEAAWENPDIHFVKLAEKLLYIQTATNIPLNYDGGPIGKDEIEKIYLTAEKIEKGHAEFTSGNLHSNLTKEVAEKMVKAIENGERISLTSDGEESEMILGTDVPLGPVSFAADNVIIVPSEFEKFKKEIENSKPTDSLSVNMVPVEGSSIHLHYSKWQS